MRNKKIRAGEEREAEIIGNEVKELKQKLRQAKREEKKNQKEEKKNRKEEKKKRQEQIREEERMRKVHMKEEKEVKKELTKSGQTGESVETEKNRKQEKVKPKQEKVPELDLLPVTWVSSYLPIRQVKNGVILTTDHRYIKLIEILPINFLLRSSAEQRNIVMSFMSYLKIAPVNLQFKIISKKADIAEYIEKIKEEAAEEKDERVRLLQEDYAGLIETLGRKEAVTRRFFLIFE